jgi:hypothetical protein
MLLQVAFKHGVVFSSARVFLKPLRGEQSKAAPASLPAHQPRAFADHRHGSPRTMHRLSRLLGLILPGGQAHSRNQAARKYSEGVELLEVRASACAGQRASFYLSLCVSNGAISVRTIIRKNSPALRLNRTFFQPTTAPRPSRGPRRSSVRRGSLLGRDLVLEIVRVEAVQPPFGSFRLWIHEEANRCAARSRQRDIMREVIRHPVHLPRAE